MINGVKKAAIVIGEYSSKITVTRKKKKVRKVLRKEVKGRY